MTTTHTGTILMADDDAEDRQLACEAIAEGGSGLRLLTVRDGEELMDYLRRQGAHADPAASPRPALIMLDLAMPRKDGRAALAELKRDPDLRKIPIVVMTTSSDEEDICRSYDLGASSYVTKPTSFAGLVDVMRGIGKYWFGLVQLPS